MPRRRKQPPIDFRATLLQDRDRFTGLDWIWEDESEDPLDTEELEEIAVVQGLMRFAAADLALMLLDDVRALARHPLTTNTGLLDVLCDIPDGIVGSDHLLFACRFHATLADVAQRISIGWIPLAMPAEEVALHLILNHAELLADLHMLPIDEDFREQVETALLDDTDYLSFLNADSTAHAEFWNPYSTDERDRPDFGWKRR